MTEVRVTRDYGKLPYKIYFTYTIYNKEVDQVYVGKTWRWNDEPWIEGFRRRAGGDIHNHDAYTKYGTEGGWGDPQFDRESTDEDEILGREAMLHAHYQKTGQIAFNSKTGRRVNSPKPWPDKIAKARNKWGEIPEGGEHKKH